MRSPAKQLAALTVAGVLGLGVAACGQTPADPEPEAPAKPEEPIKLRLGGAMSSSFGVGGTSDAR